MLRVSGASICQTGSRLFPGNNGAFRYRPLIDMKKPLPRRTAPKKAATAAKPKPAPQRPPAKKPGGLWPAVNAALATTGDAGAVDASLRAALAPKGDAGGLYAHLARSLAAQFARAAAPARRRAAKPLALESVDAAREILAMLKIYLEAANLIRARGAPIDETFAALGKPQQKKFQADLGKVALAVTREPNIADVPALMAAAIDSVIAAADVPKKRRQ
jgi:hypothetical protein